MLPHQAEQDKRQSNRPNGQRHPESEEEAGEEAGHRNPGRKKPLFARQAQSGEIGDGVIDEHGEGAERQGHRTKEHKSELQSIISSMYAGVCLKKKMINI